MKQKPDVQVFFDQQSKTFSYVVSDFKNQQCAIIDSVLNYDMASATTSTIQVDAIIDFILHHQLNVEWILETHVHADHITASQLLREKLGGKIAMSKHIAKVQNVFSKIYNVDIKSLNSGPSFDYLFEDGESFEIGEIKAYNIPTPGHTPACLSYVIGDAVFVGDTLFMPDYGTARCDFPEGSAANLYHSVHKLYDLPDDMLVYLCHDYLPPTRHEYCYKTTILEQKKKNIHIHEGIDQSTFVTLREQRDAQLSMPQLMIPAIQINMNAGLFPQPESNGQIYLKMPLNFFKK